MRKGKSQRNPTRKMTVERKHKTLNPQEEEEEEEEKEGDEEEEEKGTAGKGFYACYLLTSLCPRFKGHTYIGFTVNPRRRIRQHNGEIRSGAWRTKKRRPWEMVFCLFGFPTNVSALQFEWAWQHPTESLAVRQAAATFKSFSGVSNKIKLAYTMLNLPSWSSLGIMVNYFSTKYEKHSVGCPALPEHMKVRVCPIEELPCYAETLDSFSDDGDAKECLGDNEKYEKARDAIANVNAYNLELQACFMHEPGCYDGREDCLLDSVDGKYSNLDGRYDGHGIEKTFYGKFGWEGECSRTQCSDPVTTEMGYVRPLTPEIDHEQPFGVIKSLARASSSSSVTSETEDGHILTSTDKSISKLGSWSRGEKTFKTKEVVKDQQTCFKNGIEVIDLLSPSPKSRIGPTTKKIRISTVCPEIIDLT